MALPLSVLSHGGEPAEATELDLQVVASTPPPAVLGEGRMEKYWGNWKSSPREVTLSKDETYSENSRTVKTVTRFERLSLQSISFNPQTTTTEIFNKANFTAGEIKVQKVELTSLRHLKACGRARI